MPDCCLQMFQLLGGDDAVSDQGLLDFAVRIRELREFPVDGLGVVDCHPIDLSSGESGFVGDVIDPRRMNYRILVPPRLDFWRTLRNSTMVARQTVGVESSERSASKWSFRVARMI